MSDDDPPRDYASPACLAGEIAPGYFDPLAVDEAAARDAARWRKAERARLLAERAALSEAARHAADQSIAAHLDRVLAERFGTAEALTIAAFWPIRAEPDLRDWMARQSARGTRIALPVVTAPDQPLIFRPWSAEAPMRPGRWNIPNRQPPRRFCRNWCWRLWSAGTGRASAWVMAVASMTARWPR